MKKDLSIFVVDDERILRVTIADELRDAGYTVFEFANAPSALSALQTNRADVVITDLQMPEMDGLQFLKRLKEINPDVSVIVMTAYATVATAVQAMKLGAFDYITKPFQPDEIFLIIDRITELNSIKSENKSLRKQIEKEYDFSSYIGDNETNKELYDLIKLVAGTDSTVLLTGETGTGKELLTNIIHYNSNRKKGALIKVSCAILSRDIFESELFGHVKGAFTGADNEKTGRFELAEGGTLYLDDIDDLPLDLQVKLLRALEQREIERVGSSKTIAIDVRVIASTKKDLRQLVNEGKFREDLFYRLNVFPINIPPLRQRKKDIKYLTEYYINKFSQKKVVNITAEAFQQLYNYNWPGNTRELKNIAERMVLLSQNGTIDITKVPLELKQLHYIDTYANLGVKTLEQTLSDIEVASIKYAIEKCKNNKSKAAELLGLPPSTLRTKMDKYGLE